MTVGTPHPRTRWPRSLRMTRLVGPVGRRTRNARCRIRRPRRHDGATCRRQESGAARLRRRTHSRAQAKVDDGLIQQRRRTSAGGVAPCDRRGGGVADALSTRHAPYDLRHTAASLAISGGANVKAAQRMLGHASTARRSTPTLTSSTTTSTRHRPRSTTPRLPPELRVHIFAATPMIGLL